MKRIKYQATIDLFHIVYIYIQVYILRDALDLGILLQIIRIYIYTYIPTYIYITRRIGFGYFFFPVGMGVVDLNNNNNNMYTKFNK